MSGARPSRTGRQPRVTSRPRPETSPPSPRPIDDEERLRLYLTETRAWCRHCNREATMDTVPNCAGCGRVLTMRDVTAAPRTLIDRTGERLGRALDKRYHPERTRTRKPPLRPSRAANAGAPGAAPLTDGERLRLYLLDHDAECPDCGYDLFGLESATCPECGRTLTITAIRRGRMRWLTPAFVAGALPLLLAAIVALALPVKAVLWLDPEYRRTFIPLFIGLPMLLPAFGLSLAAAKWVNYAVPINRLPALERWTLVLVCWTVLALSALAVWKL